MINNNFSSYNILVQKFNKIQDVSLGVLSSILLFEQQQYNIGIIKKKGTLFYAYKN